MIRLELLGAHTRLYSALCGACPQGPAGCCAAPPAVAWADLGRIVSLGGLEWLLDQIRTGDLRPGDRGLLIRRVEARQDEHGAWPARCAYHGPRGCTLPPERRSATCNYYLCDDAFTEGGEHRGDACAASGRAAHEALTALYGRWDLDLANLLRDRWPDGPPWNAAFLRWLGEAYERLVQQHRRTLRRLGRGAGG